MEIRGKKVVFLGDSITQGVGASSKENRYTDVFSRNTGAVQCNYGVSGSRIANQKTPYFDNKSAAERHFILRVDDIVETDPDLIVVFGGTNDFGHGDAPLGGFADDGEYSFYGAVHMLIKKLVNKFPYARLMFMTPLHRKEEIRKNNIYREEYYSLKQYVDAMKEVCAYYSVPILDLYSVSGIQPSIQIQKEIYMPDGLHPSDKGAERIAQLLEGFVKTL